MLKRRTMDNVVYRIELIKEAGKPDVLIRKPHPRMVAPIPEVAPDE